MQYTGHLYARCTLVTHIDQGIIIIKKDCQCKALRGRLTPYLSKNPSPTLPTYRGKEEKGKIVEDKKGPALETCQSHTIKYGVNQIIPERD